MEQALLVCLSVCVPFVTVTGASSVNHLNEALNEIIEKKINATMRGVLEGITPKLEQAVAEIQRLSRELTLLRGEREACEARVARVFSSETEHIALLTSNLRRDLDSATDDIAQLKNDFTTFKEKFVKFDLDQYDGNATCGFIETRLESLNEDVDKLNRTQREISEMKIIVNMPTEDTRLTSLENRFNELDDKIDVRALEDKFQMLNNEIELLKNSTSQTMTRVSEVETELKAMDTDTTYPHPQTSITPLPEVTKMSRLLIADYDSSYGLNLRQLNIDGNKVAPYSSLKASNIEAIVYAETRKVIIFSRDSPPGIYSSPLKSTVKTKLRRKIQSYGMAVDQRRDILYFTTYNPRYAVSKMSTDGSNFKTVIDLRSFSTNPSSITLDPKNERIYVTNHADLLSCSYEGRNLQILQSDSGQSIRGVALDYHSDLLYFSVNNEIWRRSLSGGQNVMVGKVDSSVQSLVYYNNTVFSSLSNGNIYALSPDQRGFPKRKIANVKRSSIICVMP